mgnify:FL=1
MNQNKEGGERACFRARASGSACLAVGMDLSIGITILVHQRAGNCPIRSRFYKLSIYSAYLRCGDET